MINVRKPKPPKGLSYPLTTSMIEAVLAEIPFEGDVILTYRTPQSGGSLLEAHYWLLNERCPTTVYIFARTVPSEQRKNAKELIAERVLPAFAEWLAMITSLPDNSPALYTEPHFHAEYIDGHLAVSHSLKDASLS